MIGDVFCIQCLQVLRVKHVSNLELKMQPPMSCIGFPGDPLHDFTSQRFLERFVFKKPKATKSDRGGSLMQPRPNEGEQGTVNDKAFLRQDESKIPVDEQFFYTYFKQKEKLQDIEATDESATGDTAGEAQEGDDGDDDLDFAAAFGVDAMHDDEHDAEFGDLDEGTMADFDESDGEEMDLDAIAREGFGEEGSDDDVRPLCDACLLSSVPPCIILLVLRPPFIPYPLILSSALSVSTSHPIILLSLPCVCFIRMGFGLVSRAPSSVCLPMDTQHNSGRQLMCMLCDAM